MKVAKQLSVMMPNKPGQLAALCKMLAANKVNIRAISVVDTAEQGIARMVVDKSAVAKKVVKAAGFGLVVTDVILAEMPNRLGVLAKASAKLAKAKVNIQYVYGSAGPGAQRVICVFGVSDMAKAKKLIK